MYSMCDRTLVAFYTASRGVKQKKRSHLPIEKLILVLFMITFAITFRNFQQKRLYDVLSFISLMGIGILTFDFRRKYQTSIA